MLRYRVAETAIKSVASGAKMSDIGIEKLTVVIEKNSELSHVKKYFARFDDREYNINMMTQ